MRLANFPDVIVNRHSTGWNCIFQRAHAWIAYRLLLDFREDLRSTRWASVLYGALTHDHGWMEWEEVALTPDGAPHDLTNHPATKSTVLANRSVDLAAHQSLEGAVLVARHMEQLYGQREDPGLRECIRDIRARRQHWMTGLSLTPQQVEDDYEFVYWADTASLVLCVQDPWILSRLPLKLQGVEYSLTGEDGQWTMNPWPYNHPNLKLGIDVHYLDKLQFESSDELLNSLRNSDTQRLNWSLSPL